MKSCSFLRPLAARYNWCQGPVPSRGPAVEKHSSKTWFCIHLLVRIAGSNPAGAWLSVSSEYCVLRQRSLQRTDHSPRGVLPSAACLNVIEKPHRGVSLGLNGDCRATKSTYVNMKVKRSRNKSWRLGGGGGGGLEFWASVLTLIFDTTRTAELSVLRAGRPLPPRKLLGACVWRYSH
jgi:hypothetical protein